MQHQTTTYPIAMLITSLAVLLAAWPPAVASQTHTAHSAPYTVALLELYTSEGCNSCPPADEWVRSLPSQGFRTEQVIPLAFHVDYWDYLGWPDRFAQALFTQRQRALAAVHRSRTIYTPQVVLQGRDYRTWRTLQADVERINRTPARAQIAVQSTASHPGSLEVHVTVSVAVAADRQQAGLYVALYENKLHSVVTAGENTGRTLHHDFVVRRWLGPIALDSQGNLAYTSPLTLSSEWKPADLGLVVFVQQRHTGDVLQGLAMPLTK